ATEPRPREFGLASDDRYLYVAGQDSATLAAYRVEEDGTLTALMTYPVGEQPLWVQEYVVFEE
ncbi:MAG: beta-propeller fold lactonase family protein, partial [Myxococcota bacterium]